MQSSVSIFGRVLGVESAQVTMLGGGQTVNYATLLRAKRADLIRALVRCEAISKRIQVPDKVGACTELVDMAISAADLSESGDQFTLSWLMIIQQLQKIAPVDATHLVMHYALAAVSHVIGSRATSQALLGLDFLVSLNDFSQHRAMMVSTSASSAKAVCAELAAMQGFAGWNTVDLVKLESVLARMLEEWTNMRVTGALASELDYVRLFVQRVVASVSAPPDFWEMLLAKLERHQSASSPRGHYCALSGATECLLAAVPRFDFLMLFCQEFARKFPGASSVLHLLAVKMVLDARPSASLSVRFHQAINPSSLAEAGFEPAAAEVARVQTVDALREQVERVQLDWMSGAWSWFALIGRLVGDTRVIEGEARQAIDRLASQLIEGAGNEQSRARLDRQLAALLREAVVSAAIIDDPVSARLRFRVRVVPYLDLDQDSSIWKKFRQISAGLAQIEVKTAAAKQLHSRSAPLLRTVSAIAHDLLSAPRSAPFDDETLAAWAIDAAGATRGDIAAMLISIAAGHRLFGEEAATHCTRFLISLLFWHERAPQAPALRACYCQVLQHLEAHDAAAASVLQVVIERITSCCVAVRLPAEINAIAAAVSEVGPRAYQKHGGDFPQDIPAIGSEQAWQLGIADNTFNLGRISYLLSRGAPDMRHDLMFWWTSVVAKHITRVPRPFMACNLKLVLQELLARMSSDESFVVFEPLSSLYNATFGVTIRSSSSKHNLFSPLMMQGTGWQMAFGQPCALPSRSTKATIESLVACAPEPIRMLAADVIEDLLECGDQELVWCKHHPAIYALMHDTSAPSIEACWMEWQDQVIAKLPGSNAAWGLQILRDGHAVLQQVAFARRLASGGSDLAEAIANRLDGSRKNWLYEASEVQPVRVFLARLGVTLLSEPASVAALNVQRLLWCAAPVLRAESAVGARQLWLAVDETLRPLLDQVEQPALNRLTTQGLAAAGCLAGATEYVKAVLLADAASFSESYDEEQRWRETVGALIVAAGTPDCAPVSGTMLVRRLVFASNVIGGKSPKEWGEAKSALDASQMSLISDDIREQLDVRHSQIVSALMDLVRFREAGPVEAAHLWGAAFAGVPHCQSQWRLASVISHVETRSLSATHSEAFVNAITRTGIPDADFCSTVNSTLDKLKQVSIPIELKRRRLLGARIVELGANVSRSVTRAMWYLQTESLMASEGALAYCFEQMGGWHVAGELALRRSEILCIVDAKFQRDFSPQQAKFCNELLAPALSRMFEAVDLVESGGRYEQEVALQLVEAQASIPVYRLVRLVLFQTAAAQVGYLSMPVGSDARNFFRSKVFTSYWVQVERAVDHLLTSLKYLPSPERVA